MIERILTTFVLKIAALALEMHLYTYSSRYNRKSRWERRTNDNMEEKLQCLKKKKMKNYTRASRGAGGGVRLPLLFFDLFVFSLQRERSSLYARENAGTLDTCFTANYPSSLYFCPLYTLIYVRYQELNATVSES